MFSVCSAHLPRLSLSLLAAVPERRMIFAQSLEETSFKRPILWKIEQDIFFSFVSLNLRCYQKNCIYTKHKAFQIPLIHSCQNMWNAQQSISFNKVMWKDVISGLINCLLLLYKAFWIIIRGPSVGVWMEDFKNKYITKLLKYRIYFHDRP